MSKQGAAGFGSRLGGGYGSRLGVRGVSGDTVPMLVIGGVSFDGTWFMAGAGDNKQNAWLIPREALPDINDDDFDDYGVRVAWPLQSTSRQTVVGSVGINSVGPVLNAQGSYHQFSAVSDGGGPYTSIPYTVNQVWQNEIYSQGYGPGVTDLISQVSVLKTESVVRSAGSNRVNGSGSFAVLVKAEFNSSGDWVGDFNDVLPNGPVDAENYYGSSTMGSSRMLITARATNRISNIATSYCSVWPDTSTYFAVAIGTSALIRPAFDEATSTFWTGLSEFRFLSGYSSAPTLTNTLTTPLASYMSAPTTGVISYSNSHYHEREVGGSLQRRLVSTGIYNNGGSYNAAIRVVDVDADTLIDDVEIIEHEVLSGTGSNYIMVSGSALDSAGNIYLAITTYSGTGDARYATFSACDIYCYDPDLTLLWQKPLGVGVTRKWIQSIAVNF